MCNGTSLILESEDHILISRFRDKLSGVQYERHYFSESGRYYWFAVEDGKLRTISGKELEQSYQRMPDVTIA